MVEISAYCLAARPEADIAEMSDVCGFVLAVALMQPLCAFICPTSFFQTARTSISSASTDRHTGRTAGMILSGFHARVLCDTSKVAVGSRFFFDMIQ